MIAIFQLAVLRFVPGKGMCASSTEAKLHTANESVRSQQGRIPRHRVASLQGPAGVSLQKLLHSHDDCMQTMLCCVFLRVHLANLVRPCSWLISDESSLFTDSVLCSSQLCIRWALCQRCSLLAWPRFDSLFTCSPTAVHYVIQAPGCLGLCIWCA